MKLVSISLFRWLAAFEEHHVLVMTAQIFVEILNHAYFSPHQLNLLIFDECHAAVKDAPMRQVLSKLQTCDSKQLRLYVPATIQILTSLCLKFLQLLCGLKFSD